MRPSDAVAYKRMLVRLMKEYSAANPPRYDGSEDHADLAHTLGTYLPQCPTYFVTADMAAIAKEAAPSLPLSKLDQTALPSETGFMVFDAPIAHAQFADGDLPVTGAAWEFQANPAHHVPLPGEDDLCICPEEDINPDCPDAFVLERVEVSPLTVHAGQMIPVGLQEWVFNDPDVEQDEFDEPFSVMIDPGAEFKSLIATWVLMQQSITQCERAQADRAQRKLCTRAALPSDLVVVRLRRIDIPDREPGGELVPWTHRWLVGGHWRQQFYPSDKTNRPIWINPYVKGPQDKPLMLKEKVTAWVR